MSAVNKPLVLVVDDEPAMRELLALHLRRMEDPKVDLLFASNGDEAWRTALKKLPDLVILDVMLPESMSGWDVCKAIREDKARFNHTGVIMLTGIGETLNALTSPLFGADAYINKSEFSAADLEAVVRETLHRRAGFSISIRVPETVKPKKKAAAKKPAAKKAAEQAKKPAAKKPAAKKAAEQVKKPAAKKPATKKAAEAPKKPAARKPAAAKKPAAKKA